MGEAVHKDGELKQRYTRSAARLWEAWRGVRDISRARATGLTENSVIRDSVLKRSAFPSPQPLSRREKGFNFPLPPGEG